jgi:ribosomal protein S18 acetylase RimI-like enzyme
MGFELEPVREYGALLAAAGGDDFVRWALDPRVAVRGWAFEGGVAFLRAGPRRTSLTVVSSPQDAAVALPALVDQAADADWATLPLGTLALGVDVVDASTGDDWEWMQTTQPPQPHPLAGRVIDLGHDHDAEVAALLAVASPRASAAVGGPHVLTWHGVAGDDGDLLACGAHTESVPGVPHLASIATRPDVRGQGYGEAVTSSLTRAALLGGRPVVTLGMYADNAVARRLYGRLGFGDVHRWSSRRLRRPRPSPPPS